MKTASDELYEEILRERAAWKQAKRQEIEAVLRLAGDAVVGGCGGGCGCEEGSSAVASARASCGCSEAHPAKRRTSRASRQRQAAIQPGAERLPTEKPCFRTPFHFQLPDFSSIDLATQLCFALEFGVWDWPAEDCCPPLIRATDNCNPPTVWECALMNLYVDEHLFNQKNDRKENSDITPATEISAYDRQLFGAGISILLNNIDIVLWATCLIQSWSSDLIGYRISDALSIILTKSNTTNKLPFTITYVNSNSSGMFAFGINDIVNDLNKDRNPETYTPGVINDGKLGIIVTIDNICWRAMIHNWKIGGTSALCAAIKTASLFLHELIHALGDFYKNNTTSNYDRLLTSMGFEESTGTVHEDNQDPSPSVACWDEARMIASIFRWAMAKRYPCLDTVHCCDSFENDRFFAYSKNDQFQANTSCQEPNWVITP